MKKLLTILKNLRQHWRIIFTPTKMTGKFYNSWEHTGWGDRITVRGRGGKVDGHLRGINVGDELRVKLRNGTVARCIFTKVEYCRGPEDMFFGRLGFLGDFEGEPPPESRRRPTLT